MRIKAVKCNPAFSVGEGEVIVTLTDTEVGTVAKALEGYIQARPEVTKFTHIQNAVNEWQALYYLMNEGNFKEGE